MTRAGRPVCIAMNHVGKPVCVVIIRVAKPVCGALVREGLFYCMGAGISFNDGDVSNECGTLVVKIYNVMVGCHWQEFPFEGPVPWLIITP